MMQIVYFSRKSQFLAEIQHFSGDKLFIAPSPAKADGLRTLLVENATSDVVTIAKFTSDLIKHLWEEGNPPDVKRKAELLLIFGILKNKYLPDLGYEQFSQAYNLFSDLRSFTLNEDALSTVMEEQSQEVRLAVELFWRLLEATGYLDEHGAYQKISEALRSSEEKSELKRTYIFWGFQHLNGQQVDLLKALSIRYDVIIPFPLPLKEKLKKSDWISWLRDSKVIEKDLPIIPQTPRANWIKVNSREMAQSLEKLIQPNDQIILGVSKLSSMHLDIIPSKQVSYKVPHQLIQAELSEVSSRIKEEMKGQESIIDLINYLAKKRDEVKGSFKILKAIELYTDALESINELTDEEIKVDRFFLKLLFEVVSLNQPRTSYTPISSVELNIELKDMSTLEDIKRDKRVIICIDDRFDEIQGLGQSYTESIQKALSTLGPLKRSELELLFKQWEFNDLLSQADVNILMSESTLKHSLVWKRLFTGIELTLEPLLLKINKRKVMDVFATPEKKSFSGSYSASKFQLFLDCPRKFYFNYVDKIFPTITYVNDFDPMVSGTISHEIIEEYFKNNCKEEDVPALTKRVMAKYIKEKDLSIPADKMLKHELIFNHRSLNGIRFLSQLEEALGGEVEWNIEKGFSIDDGYKINGKIDCIGRFQNVVILLDFKSTKFGASSNKEIEELESLQLWAYAKAASSMINQFEQMSVIMGFVSLDNPSDSNLLSNDQDACDKIKLAKIAKQQMFKLPYPELFKAAQDKMLELSVAIPLEKKFPARPRKGDTCTFCELTKVCIKSEINHE